MWVVSVHCKIHFPLMASYFRHCPPNWPPSLMSSILIISIHRFSNMATGEMSPFYPFSSTVIHFHPLGLDFNSFSFIIAILVILVMVTMVIIVIWPSGQLSAKDTDTLDTQDSDLPHGTYIVSQTIQPS